MTKCTACSDAGDYCPKHEPLSRSLIDRIKERQWYPDGSAHAVVYIDDVEEITEQELKRGEISDNEALLKQAWELSTWTATINWRGGENQKEWLDDLRMLIGNFQRAYEARIIPKAPKPVSVSLEKCKAALKKEIDMQWQDARDGADLTMIDLIGEQAKAVLDAAGVKYV